MGAILSIFVRNLVKRKKSNVVKALCFVSLAVLILVFYTVRALTIKLHISRMNKKTNAYHDVKELEAFIRQPIYIQTNYKNSQKQLLTGTNICPLKSDNDVNKFNFGGVLYPRYLPLYYNNSLDFECMNNKIKKRNRILLWTSFVGTPDYHYGLGKSETFIANKCPVTNCELTNNRRLLNESDFVVFHMLEIKDLPKYKFDFQKWIFYLYESPLHSMNFSQFHGLFDLSSTYRSDSSTTSIYFSQSNFYWKYNSEYNSDKDFHGLKDRFSVILVSNCNDKSNRLKYIKTMQNYIPIDILGSCGRECPFDCKSFIVQKYKFYFAFENSHCKDYITEKFFGILKYDIVPVVLGKGEYDLFVPKSGYISALDFETPKHLADYLLYLSTNKTAYNSYFKWKKYVVFDSFNPFHGHICELCILLNMYNARNIPKTQNIQDLNEFWNPINDCRYSKSDKTFEFESFESSIWDVFS